MGHIELERESNYARKPRRRYTIANRLIVLFAILMGIAFIAPAAMTNLASVASIRSILGEGRHLDSAFVDRLSPYVAGVSAYAAADYNRALSALNEATGHGGLPEWYIIRAVADKGDWVRALSLANLENDDQRKLFVSILTEHADEMTLDDLKSYLMRITNYEDSVVAYAHFLLFQRRFEEALSWLTSPPRPESWTSAKVYTGMTLTYLRDWRQAEALFAQLYAEEPSPLHALWYGQVLVALGENTEGLRLFEGGLTGIGDATKARYLPTFALALTRSVECELIDERLRRVASQEFLDTYPDSYDAAQTIVKESCGN